MIYKLKRKKTINSENPGGRILHTAFSRDSKYLVFYCLNKESGNKFGNIKIFDTDNWNCIKIIDCNKFVRSIDFNEKYLAVYFDNNFIVFYDTNTWEEVKTTINTISCISFFEFKFTPDGRYLLLFIRNTTNCTPAKSSTILIYDTFEWDFVKFRKTNEINSEYETSLWYIHGFITSYCFSPDGNYLALGCDDSLVIMYDISSLKNGDISFVKEKKYDHGKRTPDAYINSISFSCLSNRLICSAKFISEIDIFPCTHSIKFKYLIDESGLIKNAIFGPDDKYILYYNSEKEIIAKSFSKGERKICEFKNSSNVEFSFSPNGKILAFNVTEYISEDIKENKMVVFYNPDNN